MSKEGEEAKQKESIDENKIDNLQKGGSEYSKFQEMLAALKLEKEVICNIDYIISLIFSSANPSTTKQLEDSELYPLKELVKRVFYRSMLIKAIMSFRTYTRKEFTPITFSNMSLICRILLAACNEYRDVECIKNLLLMTFTLYKTDTSNQKSKAENKNIYIQEEIQNNPAWNRIDLWEAIIFQSIEDDISK